MKDKFILEDPGWLGQFMILRLYVYFYKIIKNFETDIHAIKNSYPESG